MSTYKGKLGKLKYPQKYVGDVDNIVYRSGWERSVMIWADQNPDVLEWASESLIIPYHHPIKGRRARYYPDFYFKFSDGTQKIVEVKPKKETVQPSKKGKNQERYLNEMLTFAINSEKWQATIELTKTSDLEFEIWTEDYLNAHNIMKFGTIEKKTPKKKTKTTTTRKTSNIKKPGPPKRRS